MAIRPRRDFEPLGAPAHGRTIPLRRRDRTGVPMKHLTGEVKRHAVNIKVLAEQRAAVLAAIQTASESAVTTLGLLLDYLDRLSDWAQADANVSDETMSEWWADACIAAGLGDPRRDVEADDIYDFLYEQVAESSDHVRTLDLIEGALDEIRAEFAEDS